MNTRPTLEDVAREAGLGLGTVSRALSGRGKVSERARARVAEVVARLGYAPNVAARALAGQRERTQVAGQILVAYLRAREFRDADFLAACAAQGLEGVCVDPREFASPAVAARTLHARGVDAVLVNPRGVNWGAAEWAAFDWSRFAVVVVGREEALRSFDIVRHSAFDYMRTALRALWEMGHRKIRVICHSSISPDDDDARSGAVLAFKRRHGRAAGGVELHTLPVDLSDHSIVKQVVPLLCDDFDGVVLFDHFGFITQLQDQKKDHLLVNLSYAAAIAPDRNDPYHGRISGCPVNSPQIYARAAQTLFELVQIGQRGLRTLPTEHVIEPVWESRESLSGCLPKGRDFMEWRRVDRGWCRRGRRGGRGR